MNDIATENVSYSRRTNLYMICATCSGNSITVKRMSRRLVDE